MENSGIPSVAADILPDNLLVKVFGTLETVLSLTGLATPFRRFLVFSAVGTAIEFYFKPSYAYNSNGGIRKIAYINEGPGATYTPPGLFPIIAGGFTALYL